jgi:serine/threonine protein kinase
MADLSGLALGGCRLVRPIGVGGMGEVYLAEQERLGNRQVAVKVVRLDNEALTNSMLKDVERQFMREAALLGKFSHPNILPVHDAGVEDGILYLVMEYVPGGSLSDALRPGPTQKLTLPLAPGLTADLIGQVAGALQYTHDRGVVHRDVKPGNILMRTTTDGQWQLLLADYGVARAMEEASQRTQVTGTFAYMAPEQFGGTFSPASDQYALAVVAYQLLAGRTPFQGDLATITQAHLSEPPPLLRTFNTAISPTVDAVVLRALAKNPADRYPSVTAFAQALRTAALQPALMPTITATLPEGPVAGTPQPRNAPRPPPAPWPLPGAKLPYDRRPGLARAWIAVIAGVVLLVAAIAGGGLVRDQFLQSSGSPTQTSGTGSTSLSGGPGTIISGGAGVILTATVAAYIPTATASAGPGTDVTAPPPAPTAANQVVFADASPLCHGPNPIYPPWTIDTNTSPLQCPQGGGAEIKVQSSGSLACIEQHSGNIPADAYISVLVTDTGSGDAVLGFRQGQVSTGTDTFAGIGYYFKVSRADTSYLLYQFDSATRQTTLNSGSLEATPAKDFALGIMVRGNQITLYVNGEVIAGPLTDATHPTGWVALCTDGDVIFRDVQVYSVRA